MVRPALHLTIAVCLVTAGCFGPGDAPAVREDRAVETLAAAREAARDVSSYRFTLSMNASMPDRARSVAVQGHGRVNLSARAMAMTTEVRGRSFAGYIDGRTAYEQCPPHGTQWSRQNVTAENWTAATPLGRHLVLLSTGELSHNGTATRDGRAVVHLSGRPTVSALQGRSSLGTTSMPDAERIEHLEVHAWFDAETHRLVRSRFSVTAAGNGQVATATLNTTYHDFGSPVTVSVPTAARDAFFDEGCPG